MKLKTIKSLIQEILSGAILMMGSVSYAQDGVHIRVADASSSDAQKCVQLQIANPTGGALSLSSQNYRLFYNADNLKLDESSMKQALPSDQYQLRLVQHVAGVDASGTGDLAFENNLGFINFSIVQNNLEKAGVALSPDFVNIAEMCFAVSDETAPMSIILAREEATAAYGRAYIELSSINGESKLISTSVAEYTDYLTQ